MATNATSGNIEIRAEVTITLFPKVLDDLINSPSGPVSIRTKGIAEQVLAAAIPLIGPKGYSGTTGKPKEARPGRLRDSGSVVHRQDSDWAVVFNHPIALIHHEGAAAHEYAAKGKGSAYYNPNPNVWDSSRAPSDGHFYAIGPFTHPGHVANRFLVNAARSIGLTVQSPSARGRSTISTSPGKQFF